MITDELMFFNKFQDMLPLYEVLKENLQTAYPDMKINITKTQISFCNRHTFVMCSLPWRRIKGWPEMYLLVSFGLSYKKEAPRIVQSVEAYPNRWTHHVVVEHDGDIDEELMDWIDEAYQFSAIK